MDDRRAHARMQNARWTIGGGFCLTAFSSIFIISGIIYQHEFSLSVGLFFTIFGILCVIYATITRYRMRSLIDRGKPSFHVPSTLGLDGIRGDLSRDPRQPDAWYADAVGYLNQERVEKAIEAFNHTLELEPAFPLAWWGLARAWALLRNYGQMSEAAWEGLKIDPHDVNGWLLFGEACIRCGDYDRAKRALEFCLKIDPNNLRARELSWDLRDMTEQ